MTAFLRGESSAGIIIPTGVGGNFEICHIPGIILLLPASIHITIFITLTGVGGNYEFCHIPRITKGVSGTWQRKAKWQRCIQVTALRRELH